MRVFILQVDYVPVDSNPPEAPVVFTTLAAARAHAQADVREWGSKRKLAWTKPHSQDELRTWSASDEHRRIRADFFVHEQDLEVPVIGRAHDFLADVACADYFEGSEEHAKLVSDLAKNM